MKLGYKQIEVAAILGCTDGKLRRCESGRQLPCAELLLGLSILYGTEPKLLLSSLSQNIQGRLSKISLPSQCSGGVARILALDPWTRGIGVAVLDSDVIVHSGMRHVNRISVAKWFAEKAPAWAEALLERYRPQILALPALKHGGPGGRRSVHAQMFLQRLAQLAAAGGMSVTEFSPRQVESVIRGLSGSATSREPAPPRRAKRYRDYIQQLSPESRPSSGKRLESFSKPRMASVIALHFPSLVRHVPRARSAFTTQRPRESQFYAVALALAARALRAAFPGNKEHGEDLA